MEILTNFLIQITDVASGVAEDAKIYGLTLANAEDLYELIVRFVFNMLIALVIIRYFYYTKTHRKDYLFTYILISATVFLLCFLLDNVKLQLGFALGLFAIFGIIRYRTDTIPIKEMTYLFVVIGLSVINALANKKVSLFELLFTNLSIMIIIFILERLWYLRHESCKSITYDRIELIKPEREKELISDLEERTGLKIRRIEIGRIDFLQDTAKILIYYYEGKNQVNYADNSDVEPNKQE